MIDLTAEGEGLVEICSPLLVEANVRALAGFTVEESRTLTALLKRLIANIQSEDDEAGEPKPQAGRKRP